jgi:hypothetical protein
MKEEAEEEEEEECGELFQHTCPGAMYVPFGCF